MRIQYEHFGENDDIRAIEMYYHMSYSREQQNWPPKTDLWLAITPFSENLENSLIMGTEICVFGPKGADKMGIKDFN